MNARIRLRHGEVAVDLARPASLAMPVEFSGREPRHFGAPAPHSVPLAAPGFTGEVMTGASCNCSTITLTPHCNGTHTECVGHLTREPVNAHEVVPPGLLPALLLSLTPEDAARTQESSEPAPRTGDLLFTRNAIENGWPAAAILEPRALVIRTRRAGASPGANTPYLSSEAAALLVARNIEHLVIDQPSIDRADDGGLLTAHRLFFGLPRGSRTLAEATRTHCTITELARVPQDLPDGWYLLELQVPALGGDAVPSRPLLFAIAT